MYQIPLANVIQIRGLAFSILLTYMNICASAKFKNVACAHLQVAVISILAAKPGPDLIQKKFRDNLTENLLCPKFGLEIFDVNFWRNLFS